MVESKIRGDKSSIAHLVADFGVAKEDCNVESGVKKNELVLLKANSTDTIGALCCWCVLDVWVGDARRPAS